MIARLVAALLALLLASSAGAGAPAPFTADSLAKIRAKYAGRPFILALWSVSECSYCITELRLLGKLAKSRPGLPLVLVATDSPELAPAMQATLRDNGLAEVDSWVFDDAAPERLRIAIDPAWYGELPRTYLYDARHRRDTLVGVLSEKRLRDWLRKQGPVD